MFLQMRKRLVYALFGTVFLMGGAKAAYAHVCWEESGGVMCVVCGDMYCCVTWFANGECCEPTIEHCEDIT